MRAGIFGRGRLGSAIARELSASPGCEMEFILGRDDPLPSGVDVAVDASAAGAVEEHLDWAVRTGTRLVIGTTGWDRSLLGDPARFASTGIMIAPNFSLSVAFLARVARAAGAFASAVGGFDGGISERHHRKKADAPSGTARLLASSLAEGLGDRSGFSLSAWEEGKVPVSSLRCGSEIGWHEVRLDSPWETLTFAHEARSRDLFARGAAMAVSWMAGRTGVWTFDDMAAELVDGAFGTGSRA